MKSSFAFVSTLTAMRNLTIICLCTLLFTAVAEAQQRRPQATPLAGDPLTGLNAAQRFLLGSVSTKVVHHARCAVLIAHPK